jgi:predicted HD phosphohydrolase
MLHEVFARKAYDPDLIKAGVRVTLQNPEIAKTRA